MMVTPEHLAALTRLLARQELAIGALEEALAERDRQLAARDAATEPAPEGR